MAACAGGGNFNCPIPGPKSAAPEDNALAGLEDDLSRTIVDCEVNSSAWTLMHRYNKATELLDSVLNVSSNPDAQIQKGHRATSLCAGCHALLLLLLFVGKASQPLHWYQAVSVARLSCMDTARP